jgi:hypothetical protein
LDAAGVHYSNFVAKVCFRVKSDGLAMSALLPLYPRKPTFIARGGMSEKCHERTHAPQQLPAYSITIGPGDQNCATSKPRHWR